MEITSVIIICLLATNFIVSIGGLYIVYRLAILVKSKDLYEAKYFVEKEEPAPQVEDVVDENNDFGPLTSNRFADVRQPT